MDLVVDCISHHYGLLAVLDDVSFDVRSGEIATVLGPSGCGKSTLLRIIGGLERPSKGEARTRGRPGRSLNPVTMIFQDFALSPWMTVAGNIEFPLLHHAMPGAERRRRVAEAVARVGLQGFENVYPARLSGGMRQRVGVARALAVEPAVLLMDEPFSSLDMLTGEALTTDFLRLWNESSFTGVYVTHDIAHATLLSHRVIVLSERPGRVQGIVEIDAPLSERVTGHRNMLAAQEHIRSLIRASISTVAAPC